MKILSIQILYTSALLELQPVAVTEGKKPNRITEEPSQSPGVSAPKTA